VAIPMDRNSMQKESEKTLKYMSLYTEMQQLWNMKLMIIPVIIGATRIVTKGLKKNLAAVLNIQYLHYKRQLGDYRSFKRRSAREKRPVTRSNNKT
jgi:hypothetical protein